MSDSTKKTEKHDDEWMAVTRRDFLRAGVGVGAAALLAGCESKSGSQAPTPPPPTTAAPTVDAAAAPVAAVVDDLPVAALPDGVAEKVFSGDDLKRFHGMLWDKPKALAERGGLPTDASKFEKVKVIIVGGGLSGLSAAYMLKDHKPLLLEGAVRLGGNAKGQSWGDIKYSIGSAYITAAAMNSEHMVMLKELGLTEKWRHDDPTHDQMYIGGTLYPEFWFGGTDKKRAKDFQAAWNFFKNVRDNAYPDIPALPDSQLSPEQFAKLDQTTFLEHVRQGLGKQLHPHVEDVVRQYCWSSFGADPSEISAAAGHNFLSSDLGGMYVLPGGNSAISDAMIKHLRAALGQNNVRSSQMVLDIRRAPDGVRVTYVDARNQLQTVLAETCIVSTPKFVAKKLIDTLPAAQLDAIAKLKYRSYIVCSVLVDQPRKADFHDLFCIAGQAPAGTLAEEMNKRPFTDVVLATFATSGHPTRCVLNLYRGLPYDTGRADLFAEGSYDRFRGLIEPALPATMKALGLDMAKIVDTRMTRWGHPLVIPAPGLISSGVPAAAAAPHDERIFFAQQDNHAMPAFESGFAAAAVATKAVRKVLGA
jgi:protoporphyrinogen oxidase